jgi:YVTN family beta-propeller protein
MTAASALIGAFAVVWSACWDSAHGQGQQIQTSPLFFEGKIPLGSVAGRIDHMAVDLIRRRLFVAELGNNTVGVIDLTNKKVVHRISGLSGPQGIAYVPPTDTVFVANGGDGSVRVFRASDYSHLARIELGHDADNVRFDAKTTNVLVGFGDGAIAVIDPKTNKKIAEVRLPAHPESFQIDSSSGRVFVNLPNVPAIGVVGNGLRLQETRNVRYAANFAMAIDPDKQRVIVAFRRPTRLVAYEEATGRAVAEAKTCGDVDDLFYDRNRKAIYVICGSGAIDVLDAGTSVFSKIANVRTVAGARTGLFVSEFDNLFLAVRGHSGEPPALSVYRTKRRNE